MVDMAAIGREGRVPCDSRRAMIQKVSMIGTPRTSRATAILAFPRIDSTASAYPTANTPVVPMKTLAGWKFQGRKPASEPARIAHSSATIGCYRPTVIEMTPRVTAAMSETPVDRPSSPSMKLMLLIMPTIQSAVYRRRGSRRTRRGRREHPPWKSGVVDERDQHAQARARAGQDELQRNCQRARTCHRSSMNPKAAARARRPSGRQAPEVDDSLPCASARSR